MNIPATVAKIRYIFHLNMIDVNNVLNQLKLRTNDKAEEIAKKHTMIALTDCLPRFNEKAYKKLFEEDEA